MVWELSKFVRRCQMLSDHVRSPSGLGLIQGLERFRDLLQPGILMFCLFSDISANGSLLVWVRGLDSQDPLMKGIVT